MLQEQGVQIFFFSLFGFVLKRNFKVVQSYLLKGYSLE